MVGCPYIPNDPITQFYLRALKMVTLWLKHVLMQEDAFMLVNYFLFCLQKNKNFLIEKESFVGNVALSHSIIPVFVDNSLRFFICGVKICISVWKILFVALCMLVLYLNSKIVLNVCGLYLYSNWKIYFRCV